MSSLYHYCTVETLKSILSNKTLRFSDIRKSNDPNEIDFLFDKYMDWNSKENNYSFSSKKENNIIKFFKSTQLENMNFLVLCLSRNYDDLSMWNRYACKGVVIEFDETKLKETLNHIKLGIPDEFIEKNYSSSCSVFKIEDVKYYNDKTIKDYFDEKQVNTFGTILNESPFIKSDFYKDEKEVRIVYPYNSNNNINLNYLSRTNKAGYHEEKLFFKSISTNMYQHKLVIDIPISPDIIESITIGPDSNITSQDLEEILFVCDIKDIKIYKSKGHFR